MPPMPSAQKPVVSPAELAQLEHAFATDPTSDAYGPLAEAYLSLSRFMEAMVVCKKGVKSHPGTATPRLLLARVYAEQNKEKKALEELASALQVAPNDVATLKLAGHLALKNGEEVGREHLKKALALAPNDSQVLELCTKWGIELPKPEPPPPPPPPAPVTLPPAGRADASSARGSPTEQAVVFGQPAASPAPARRSGARMQQGQRPDAPGPRAQPRVDRPPAPHPRPAPSFEELSARYGPSDEVSRSIRRPTSSRGLVVTVAIAAIGAVALGGYFVYTRWKANRDREISKLLKEVVEFVGRDSYEAYKQACEKAEKVLDKDPNSLAAHSFLGYSYAIRWGELGEGEKAATLAREHLEAAKKLKQDHSHLLATEHLVRFFSGEQDQAQADLEKLVAKFEEEKKRSALLYTTLGKMQTQNGDLDRAIETLKKAQNIDQASPRVFAALGNAYRRRGEEVDAANSYESALRYEASHAEACVGVALMALPDPAKREVAQRFVEKVLKADPPASPRQTALAHVVSANLLYEENKRDEARKAEDRAFSLDPQNGELFILKSQRLLSDGQAGQAIAEAKKAIQLEPKRAGFYIDLARAYLQQQGGCRDAVDLLGKAQLLIPGNARITLLAGEAYEKCNDQENARRQYEKAAGSETQKSPEARRRLASLLRQQKQYVKAVALYERATTEAIGNLRLQSDILTDLARMYEEQNDLKKAQEAFRRALSSDDRNPEAIYWYGHLFALDRNQAIRCEARDFYENYLKYAPAGQHAADVKRTLDTLQTCPTTPAPTLSPKVAPKK